MFNYKTVKDALSMPHDNESEENPLVLILSGFLTEDVVIPEGRYVKIYMNTYCITAKDGAAITVDGGYLELVGDDLASVETDDLAINVISGTVVVENVSIYGDMIYTEGLERPYVFNVGLYPFFNEDLAQFVADGCVAIKYDTFWYVDSAFEVFRRQLIQELEAMDDLGNVIHDAITEIRAYEYSEWLDLEGNESILLMYTSNIKRDLAMAAVEQFKESAVVLKDQVSLMVSDNSTITSICEFIGEKTRSFVQNVFEYVYNTVISFFVR